MPRPKNDKPAGTTFVGYSALTHNSDKIRQRRRFDKIKTSAGHDQLIYGASLLRSPETETEDMTYQRYSVIRSSGGEFFTTIVPLPEELRPYFIGTKPTKEQLIALRSRAEAARQFIENL